MDVAIALPATGGIIKTLVIDMLNMWGLTLTGLGLIVGALVRWNAFWGAITMLFYWAATLQGGLLAGLPLAHGWVVDDHIVYAALLSGSECRYLTGALRD